IYGAVIYTNINPKKIYVGDRVQFTITVIVPKGATVKPPEAEGSFGKVVVKEWNFHKKEKERVDSIFYDYILTTYTPEPCTIPSLNFIIETKEKAETLHTDPIPLEIITLVKNDSAELKDIKPPFKAGKPPMWWLWIVSIIGVIFILIFSFTYLSKRYTKVPPPPPPMPPYEEAMEALRNLGLKKYIQRGLFREYVFELSEIFKRYIGRVFNCNALEFTTEEILSWLKTSEMSIRLKKIIEYFFETTDPVKFARYIPEISVIERLEKEVREFLEETKPKEELPSESKKGEEAVEQKEKEKVRGGKLTK
ncbi:MAG: hypothetical protein N2053_07435, partial [Chitinispirillaceae bacterium]|nr:hypothetical protein [Chitinispirillaceae bacterium]